MQVKVLKEEWIEIKYFPNYLISNFGRVRNKLTNKLKALRTDHFGYKITDLYNNGISKTIKVHKLVAEAFIGERPKNFEINHIDGIKINNIVTNLEYVTRSENIKHAFKLGLIKIDSKWIEKSKKASNKMHKIYDYSGQNNPNSKTQRLNRESICN